MAQNHQTKVDDGCQMLHVNAREGSHESNVLHDAKSLDNSSIFRIYTKSTTHAKAAFVILFLLLAFVKIFPNTEIDKKYLQDCDETGHKCDRDLNRKSQLRLDSAFLRNYDTSSSYNPNAKINVHLVSHTHDDVGWVTTVDNYFTGSKQHIGYVQSILDSVMISLERNPHRKFMYVEIAFFMRWWREQNRIVKRRFKKLVRNGQFTFISGGWSMNDEATVHYVSVIDQMTLGHKFLMEEFGVTPRIGWQIDPFGHSNTQAELFAEMGFDAFFMGRIDADDLSKRKREKEMEFMWYPSQSKPQLSILGSVMYAGYGPPNDLNLGDGAEPVIDDAGLDNYNIEEFVKRFVDSAVLYANASITTNVMFPMGTDFTYRNAEPYFKNIDKIIHYLKKDGRVNAFYSNPEIYTDAVLCETRTRNYKWRVNRGDFFPYSHSPHSYWTGYFTSRPALKRFERQAMGILLACKQAEVFLHKRVPEERRPYSSVHHHTSFRLSRAMGVVQHHDGVSGTEKQFVAEDYIQRLQAGVSDCEMVISRAYESTQRESFINNSIKSKDMDVNHDAAGAVSENVAEKTRWVDGGLNAQMCLMATNVSVCGVSERATAEKGFSVVLYNSLGFLPSSTLDEKKKLDSAYGNKNGRTFDTEDELCRVQQVRLPINEPFATVMNAEGNGTLVASNVVTVSDPVKHVRADRGSANYELVFTACVSPLSFARYVVVLGSTRKPTVRTISKSVENKENVDETHHINPTTNVPPQGTTDLEKDTAEVSIERACRDVYDDNVVFVENVHMKLWVSCTLGTITHVSTGEGRKVSIKQQFMYYISNNGTQEINSPSGAYIFRPVSQTPENINPLDQGTDNPEMILIGSNNKMRPIIEVVRDAESQGEVVELRVQINPWLSQTIRLPTSNISASSKLLDVNVIVGPLPVVPNRSDTDTTFGMPVGYSAGEAPAWVGKEFIVRYTTDIKSQGVFYTDANGREMQKRVRNHRDTWVLKNNEPVSQNYYPVNTRISLKYESGTAEKGGMKQFSILTDRSLGGTSMADGALEVMLHRRCLHDDYLGVHEPLNEPGYIAYPAWKQTGGCSSSGPREAENNKDVTTKINSNESGFCACNATYNVNFECGHAIQSCVDVCPDLPVCVFRRTGDCSPTGPRQSAGDLRCGDVIGHGLSGVCECGQTYTVPFTCDHEPITCKTACLSHSRDKQKRIDPNNNGLIVNSHHQIHVAIDAEENLAVRHAVMDMAYPMIVMVTNSTTQTAAIPAASLVTGPLPRNVHLLSLEMHKPGQLLLRLENFLPTGENTEQNQVSCFDLKALMNSRVIGEIVDAQQVSLTANKKIYKNRSAIIKDTEQIPDFCPSYEESTIMVRLYPMEIVTLELIVI
eukprot:CFRG0152T1